MDEGGCLYLDFSDELFPSDDDDDDDDNDDDVTIVYSDLETQVSVSETIGPNLTSKVASLPEKFDNSVSSSREQQKLIFVDENKEDVVECCICYDPISTEKNNCVTECGHQFCFKCLATSMMTNGCKCPCCRSPLVEMSSDDDEDAEEDEETEIDDESILSSEEDEMECDIVELTRRLKSKGFKMQDVLSMLLGRYVKDTTDLTIFDLNEKFDTIVDEADNEVIENEAMGLEDMRQ